MAGSQEGAMEEICFCWTVKSWGHWECVERTEGGGEGSHTKIR